MGRYHFPIAVVAPRIPSFLFGRSRSLAQDIDFLFRAVGATPHISGAGFIPALEPFILVTNHFHRSDIPSWWISMAVLKATADNCRGRPSGAKLRVIVASQWTYQARLQGLVAEPLTRFMIGRIARAYDFLSIEPVALGARSASKRAQSMRRILSAAHAAATTHDILCLAPEGGDTPGGVLTHPPAGAGRFMLMLAASGLRFVPAGAYAESENLIVNFGEPFPLSAPREARKTAADEWASAQVMHRIAALLPRELQGAYGSQHESAATG